MTRSVKSVFFFNDTATTEIYTLSLHDALPIYLRQKISFMNKDGKKIGVIHQLQHDGKTITSAKVGQEVACSVQNVTIGRQIAEEDVFYTLPSSSDAKKLLNQFTQKLSSEERNTLNEIVEIKRKINPVYGY